MAYKLRNLQPRGLISGIKKKFRNEPQQCCSKNVFHLLVFNEALKRLPFHFQVERRGGGGGGGEGNENFRAITRLETLATQGTIFLNLLRF